jgi:hypothetical protein
MDNEKCRLKSHWLILNLANETARALRDHLLSSPGTKRATTRTRDGMSVLWARGTIPRHGAAAGAVSGPFAELARFLLRKARRCASVSATSMRWKEVAGGNI